MPTYTEKEIEQLFAPIWREWLNKNGPSAALKAFGFALKSGVSIRQIQLACNIYSMEHVAEDPSFTYTLANFLNHDHWKDTVEATRNPEAYYKRLEEKKQEALSVVKAWSETRKSHWTEIVSEELTYPIALIALQNTEFRLNWKKALDKAAKIFQYKKREGEPHAKLTLSFRWFCNVSPTKHTVLKILEGEYGHPVEDVFEKKPPPKELSEEEVEKNRRESIELMKEIGFGKYDKRFNKDSKPDSSEKTDEQSERSGQDSIY